MSDTTLRRRKRVRKSARPLAALAAVLVSAALLGVVFRSSGSGSSASRIEAQDAAMMDKYDMYMTNEISNALEGVLSVEKVYWLSDSDLVAPKPQESCYGEADSPAELMWLLEEASDLIDGQEMLFNENTPVWEGDKIYYYYDETILVITWKEIRDRSVFTISEVKIADASQMRRFLAGGEYGSDKLYTTTDMAQSVNAVVAMTGDFYSFRRYGTIVYGSQLQRFEGHYVDTCFITEAGDLLFARRNELETEEEARQLVEENGVRFSLAFGPVLVDEGKVCVPAAYTLGDISRTYSRAALCQMDSLHYLLVNSCGEGEYTGRQDMKTFATYVAELGCQKAYALDGGQSTVIAMDGEMISNVDFDSQREVSDIIYFATALPEGE